MICFICNRFQCVQNINVKLFGLPSKSFILSSLLIFASLRSVAIETNEKNGFISILASYGASKKQFIESASCTIYSRSRFKRLGGDIPLPFFFLTMSRFSKSNKIERNFSFFIFSFLADSRIIKLGSWFYSSHNSFAQRSSTSRK